MKRSLLFIIIFGLAGVSCTSLYKKGQKQFSSGEYQYAISSFSKILEKDPDNKEANLLVAESYRLSNRIEKSSPYYEKLVEEDATFENYYRLAQSYKSQGKLDLALEGFKKAKGLTLDDAYSSELTREVAILEKTSKIDDYWPYVELVNYTLLNTPGPDYSPIINEGYLYFTSSRQATGIYPGTGMPYTKLFRTKADGIKVDVQNIQALPEFQNEAGLNQGAIAISPDGNTIIYARGNSTSNKDLPEVHLFVSYFRGGAFTQPIWMPLNEEESWWNSTPAFSPDGSVLYFASNRPGGHGGIDLYKATKLANGDFGNPVNLGPEINTPGNEMFPRLMSDGKFFFASDGHPGFGKLDLFVAESSENGTLIKNLGSKINSVSDDFGIFFTRYPEDGFITSNRDGGAGDDDIYYFEDKTPKPKLVNIFLNVSTKEKQEDGSEVILPRTRVALYDDANVMTGGDFTNQSGKIRLTLAPDADFSMIASKSGYFSKSITYSTKGRTPSQDELIQEITNIVLDTMIVLDALILEKSIVLDNIYYDLNKAEIRVDAALELDKLISILKDNPTISIELSSHTDDRATDAYNDALSQRRAESAVAYMVSKGIAEERLVPKGYGKRQLKIQNAQTEEEHQINRRTEFKVIDIK